MKKIIVNMLFIAAILSVIPTAYAGSKILATSGAMQIEGAAGGGIVPWAVIGGYGSDDEWRGAMAVTQVNVDDFKLDTFGVLYGFNNRFEISYSRQELSVEPLNLDIQQDVLGAKLRLFGDLIYNKSPQFSLGLQYKNNKDNAVPFLLGARDDSDVDIYLAATKLKLDAIWGRNLVLNGVLRWTRANQTGLLGFSDSSDNNRELVFETSAALLINRHWATGLEYRQKPDQLVTVNEDDWKDIFVAWFPNKRFSFVLAYSNLGDIAGLADQQGLYLSLQISQ